MTNKECTLIQDMKAQEQVCAETYTRHAQAAKDPQLKTLFEEQAATERHHLDLLTQMENGTVPFVDQAKIQKPKTFSGTYGNAADPDKANDEYLCRDLLAAEKHASSLYDTCIFEFTDQGAREVLNYIEKSEQFHGKELYDYMSANGMQA